ncbi:heavy-metal-associated domain-containing protein [Streptomyces sp. NPDC050418]|uniref:heavy-metal-associated domain-containing protein n=1 Tax=Streptomyces sp. NPDC050418 TaxID=3365612 RepID=UPI0037AC8EEF
MTAQTELPQAETTGSCCGGGSCSSTPAADTQDGITTVYQVTGMTCGHCEGAVSSEISELPGVTSVKAVASTGQVTVISAAPLDDEAVRAAVDEAGYELTGRA